MRLKFPCREFPLPTPSILEIRSSFNNESGFTALIFVNHFDINLIIYDKIRYKSGLQHRLGAIFLSPNASEIKISAQNMALRSIICCAVLPFFRQQSVSLRGREGRLFA
jgi:hypothetical protein